MKFYTKCKLEKHTTKFNKGRTSKTELSRGLRARRNKATTAEKVETIIALDISTRTGWSVLHGGQLVCYGLIKLDEKTSHFERYKVFNSEIIKLFEEHKPNLIALEAVYHGKNVKTTAYLNGLRGIAMSLIPNTVNFRTGSVSTIRKDVLGQGKKHDKKEVFTWAISKFNLKDFKFSTHNDITDSILISWWAHKLETLDSKTPQ